MKTRMRRAVGRRRSAVVAIVGSLLLLTTAAGAAAGDAPAAVPGAVLVSWSRVPPTRATWPAIAAVTPCPCSAAPCRSPHAQVGGQGAVGAGGVAAGEVAEKNQVGRCLGPAKTSGGVRTDLHRCRRSLQDCRPGGLRMPGSGWRADVPVSARPGPRSAAGEASP